MGGTHYTHTYYHIVTKKQYGLTFNSPLHKKHQI